MKGISPWAAAAGQMLAEDDLSLLYATDCGDINFTIHQAAGSLWLVSAMPKGGKIAFRLAYSPEGDLAVTDTTENDDGVLFTLNSVIGDQKVQVTFPETEGQPLRYTTTIKPRTELFIPFWPKDIVMPGKSGRPENTAGQIHTKQVGTRSGVVYFSLTKPQSGSVLYLQNLTALNDYCEQTKTSCGGVVGGTWPELGFSLPPTQDTPLAAGEEIVISDALVVFSTEVPESEPAVIQQYLNMLAAAYLELPKPDTFCHDWPTTLDKGLKDLLDSPGCWSQVAGHQYFNAYVSDYVTPPEIMVQLAVLLPLIDYEEWRGVKLEVINKVKDGLSAFYDDNLKTIMRWLPAAEGKLQGDEEQKKPKVMDSWYLHHPLLNLSRLALKGDKVAKRLFIDSLGYAIKVANHFNYRWPVFYQMETLEVLKAETSPGKGGEKDVAGIYAHVMVQAYDLTGDEKYLREAEKAALSLKGLGFEMFYQANNTCFASGAMLRLYKITKKEVYLELSYLCMANIFNNVQLWDCNYGYGKNFPSFFAIFPLSDAPYTAVYEEQEVFCALHDYLVHAEGVDILPSVSLLAAEYIRYVVFRAIYYYPPMLPKDMLKEKPQTGEVDPNLWIALEDLHDGWEQSGNVGQEVYGAGNAFGILPRQYMRVPGQEFMVFIDYPTQGFSVRKGDTITFKVKGDSRLSCRMALIKTGTKKIPGCKVEVKSQGEIKPVPGKNGNIEYALNGGCDVRITLDK
jgi:hypothetical protein